MSGIIFQATQQYDKVRDFYRNVMDCEVWLEQADCTVFRHGNFLLGFCDRDRTDSQGLFCFVYESRTAVDEMYTRLKATAEAAPKLNEKYHIYHFFAKDPEGRTVECQVFEDDLAMP